MNEWEKEEEKKAALPEDDPAKVTWMRVVNFFGGVVEIDKQERLMLPRKIRERFSLVNAEVVVTGQQLYLVVDRELTAEQEIEGLLTPETNSAGPMKMSEARHVLAEREARKSQGL